MHQGLIYKREIIIGIEYIEYFNRSLVCYLIAAECYQLIKDRECITHSSICFLRNYVECLFAYCYTFISRYFLEISDSIRHRYTIEIIYLASTKNSWQHLMFLGCSKNKDSI